MVLCGALDNAAWTITSEMKLFPAPSEYDTASRKFCSLNSAKFSAELKKHLPAAHARIQASSEWLRVLKDLRDPVAHRIPTYIAPAVLHEPELANMRSLEKQASDLFKEERFDEGMEKWHESVNVGVFMPMILHETGKKERITLLAPGLIEHDQALFLDLLGSLTHQITHSLSPHSVNPYEHAENIGSYLNQKSGQW